MRRSLPVLALVIAAAAALAGCSRGEAASEPRSLYADEADPRAPQGTLPRLVFFINPDGRPCQMQDSILREMSAELNGKVDLVYYRTTSRADMARFNEYGVRSLPQLVLTDPSGREIRRATPGVQGADAVRRLIAR